MEKESKVTLISTIIVVGFFLAVVFHYVLGFYFELNPPFNSFVYPAYKAFCDFKDVVPYAADLAPYKSVTSWVAYFPIAYILMFPFTLLKSKLVAYIIYCSIFMGYLISVNIKEFFCENLSKVQNFQNIFIISFLSYSVLFNLDKGNFDMMLFVIFAISMYCFKSGKYLASAVLLAVVNAIKPFPILFLFLFLFEKKYKEFFYSLILTALLVVGGFFALKGNVFDQMVVFIKDLTLFKRDYIYATGESYLGMMFTSSLYMPLKWLLCEVSKTPILSIHTFVKVYNIFWNILTFVMLYFAWREKEFWKKVALLTINMLALPYLVFDYKLIFLFVPLWFFVNSKEKTRFDLAYTVLFALLFIPKGLIIVNPVLWKMIYQVEFLLRTPGSWYGIGLSVILNPLIMLTIAVLIIVQQYMRKKDEKGV